MLRRPIAGLKVRPHPHVLIQQHAVPALHNRSVSSATIRSFTSSSPLTKHVRDDETNPWQELDDSCESWHSESHDNRVRTSEEDGDTDGRLALSGEERLWLQSVNSDVAGLRKKPLPSSTARGSLPDPSKSHKPASLPPSAHTDVTLPPRLTHLDATHDSVQMVDIGSKAATARSATALCKVLLPPHIVPLLRDGASKEFGEDPLSPSGKGPVFNTARLAGIMAAKRTHELVPLCHSVALDSCDVDIDLWAEGPDSESPYISILASASTRHSTGVEMEALTAASVAGVTVWDMLKSVAGKEMSITDLKVVRKAGGKSGSWVRDD